MVLQLPFARQEFLEEQPDLLPQLDLSPLSEHCGQLPLVHFLGAVAQPVRRPAIAAAMTKNFASFVMDSAFYDKLLTSRLH